MQSEIGVSSGLAVHSISLFSGVGMLDEGLRAGLEYLGVSHRTVCHVEREAHAAAVLAARMEEGSMDAAPVWSDVCTFDAGAWRGSVDCVVAGFPCQDLSVAGRRAGLDGKRSGLFFEVVRIAADSGAWLLFLENVAGIASATASVVDPEEGELDERAAARVVGELADCGWDAEWITLAASDVGASHGRARWFCLAWRRLAHPHHDGGEVSSLPAGQRQERADPDRPSREVVDANDTAGPGHWRRTEPQESEPARSVGLLADSIGSSVERWRDPGDLAREGREAQGEGHQRQRRRPAADGGDCAVADAEGDGQARRLGIGAAHGAGTEPGPVRHGAALADASEQRQPQPAGGEHARPDSDPHGLAEPVAGGDALPLFAPGPADPRWPAILAEHPELAPALEPAFRRVVDGLAFDMGDSRAARLKCIGNGVVALQAAAAFVVLAGRAGAAVRQEE